MLTKFRWTVYLNGALFDVMTDSEVEELIQLYDVKHIDSTIGLIEF